MNEKKRWDVLAEIINNDSLERGAEVGVKGGQNIQKLLDLCPTLHMIACDAWDPALRYQNWGPKMQRIYEGVFDKMARNYAGRITKAKGYSLEIAKTIPDASLDFVFIDAGHDFDDCKADIEAWLPKIKSGGFISGHDYGHPTIGDVKGAVDEIFGDPLVFDDYTWVAYVADEAIRTPEEEVGEEQE